MSTVARVIVGRVLARPLTPPGLLSSLAHAVSPPSLLTFPRPLGSMASGSVASTLEGLNFVNSAVKSLPVEDSEDNYVRTVQGVISLARWSDN